MKIIFLDFDGVLNNLEFLINDQEARSYYRQPRGHIDRLCPDNMKVLNDVLDRTEAKIVVSSHWRLMNSVERLQEILDFNNVQGRVLDKTPEPYEHATRDAEIKHWLDNTAHNIKSFVIVDDEHLMPSYPNNFVQTTIETGLTPENGEELISILNKEA